MNTLESLFEAADMGSLSVESHYSVDGEPFGTATVDADALNTKPDV